MLLRKFSRNCYILREKNYSCSIYSLEFLGNPVEVDGLNNEDMQGNEGLPSVPFYCFKL